MQVNYYSVNNSTNPNFGALKITDRASSTIFHCHDNISFWDRTPMGEILDLIEKSPVCVSITTERKTGKLMATLTEHWFALHGHPYDDPEIIIKETKFNQFWSSSLSFLKKVQKAMKKIEKQ